MSSGRPHRIVFLDSFPRLGGAERSLVELLARLDRDRFEPVFVTTFEGETSRAVDELDIPVHFCPMPEDVSDVSRTSLDAWSLARKLPPLAGYLRRLACLVLSLRPRLTYSNALKDHVASALLSPTIGRPVVWHFRDLLENRALRACVETLALATPTHLIGNSHFTVNQFPRLSRRHGRAAAVHNGIDLEETDRLRREGPAGAVPTRDGLVVGLVGALCPEKGQELLIRALSAVARERDVSAWIVGDEIYDTSRHRRGFRAGLEHLARDLGVRERVHFLGWRHDVPALIDRMDVLVSISDPALSIETFGRTVVEAMACGVPVVAVDYGGPRETVVHNETGLLFRDYRPEVLAGALLELARDDVRRTRMGGAARRRVERYFTIDRYVSGVETYLDAILARRVETAS